MFQIFENFDGSLPHHKQTITMFEFGLNREPEPRNHSSRPMEFVAAEGKKVVVQVVDAGATTKKARKIDPVPTDPGAYELPIGYTHDSAYVCTILAEFKRKSPFERRRIVQGALEMKELTEKHLAASLSGGGDDDWLRDKPQLRINFGMIGDRDVRLFLAGAFKELHGINLFAGGDTKVPEEKFVYGVVVVPIGNSNSHNYEIGLPVMRAPIDEKMRFNRFGSKVDMGNQLTRAQNELRLPTFEEYVAVATTRAM